MTFKTQFRLAFFFFALAWVSGCSSTNQAYLETLKIVFSQSDKTVTAEQVRSSTSDLLAVKHGERNQVILALAFIEDDKYKWVSADHAILTMRAGVITQTHGLPTDVFYKSNLAANPIISDSLTTSSWDYIADVENYGYGLPVTTTWRRADDQILDILNNKFATFVVEEQVEFTGAKPFYEANLSWINRYWFSSENGEMLKSEQTLSPVNDPLTMVYLSRAQRLVDGKEPTQ